jgi:hypothetical protein
MDKKAAKSEALTRALEMLSGDAPVVAEVPPHEATCPSCGHTWLMANEFEGDYDTGEG